MSTPHQTILLIEDERSILDLAREALTEEGYRVVGAASHAEGLLALSAFRFALVLTDTAGSFALTDPERWGPLERIRDAAGDCPVVIFTAHSLALFADFHERGFAGFIAKPFDLDALLATVRGLLGR